MGAMGLMRVLCEDLSVPARMSWVEGRGVLHGGVDKEELLDRLAAAMAHRAKAFEFNWADSSRGVPAVQFGEACASPLANTRAKSFLAGWATDTVLRDGNVTTTRLDLTSGRQKLIADLRALAKSLSIRSKAVAAFEQALFGMSATGAEYEKQTSFGWDPAATRSHATENRAPGETTPPGKPGLVWLAAESLPLHPVVPISATRTQTIGCRERSAYVWPAWSPPLNLGEIRLLRARPVDTLADMRGITEVWRARFIQIGKYGALAPGAREC